MKSKRRMLYTAACAVAVFVLILDSKAVMDSCRAGIELCLRTVIPSLFPFFFLCGALTSLLSSQRLSIFEPMCRLLGIPAGAEGILLTGLLGGYPVGAQSVALTWRAGQLSKETAHRMLGFCSNAGPAFLFGMTAVLFDEPAAAWVLWLIHILSALITGCLLPGKTANQPIRQGNRTVSPASVLRQALIAISSVCGWVILFRILIDELQRWCLWRISPELQIITAGLLELTNGFVALTALDSDGARFILCSGFLAFGGICIYMQTASVTAELGTGMYFPGKLLQCAFSILLSAMVQGWIFPAGECLELSAFSLLLPVAAIAAILLLLKKRKNNSSNLALLGV